MCYIREFTIYSFPANKINNNHTRNAPPTMFSPTLCTIFSWELQVYHNCKINKKYALLSEVNQLTGRRINVNTKLFLRWRKLSNFISVTYLQLTTQHNSPSSNIGTPPIVNSPMLMVFYGPVSFRCRVGVGNIDTSGWWRWYVPLWGRQVTADDR
jgi:hypothetical protein